MISLTNREVLLYWSSSHRHGVVCHQYHLEVCVSCCMALKPKCSTCFYLKDFIIVYFKFNKQRGIIVVKFKLSPQRSPWLYVSSIPFGGLCVMFAWPNAARVFTWRISESFISSLTNREVLLCWSSSCRHGVRHGVGRHQYHLEACASCLHGQMQHVFLLEGFQNRLFQV